MAHTYTCPVCGMGVTPATAEGQSEYEGNTYYFCSQGEKEIFDKNPEKYIIPEPQNNPS